MISVSVSVVNLCPSSVELLFEAKIVFDDAIVHDDDFSSAVAVRMSIFLGRSPVGGPARMSDPISSVEGFLPDSLFEISKLAFGAADLEDARVAGYGDPGGIVPAVFEAPESLQDHRYNVFLTYVADDAAHVTSTTGALFGQRETELFDDRVGQHFAGDPLDLGLSLFAREATIKGDFEILPLADALKSLVAHLFQRALDGFTLRIENCSSSMRHKRRLS